MKIRLFLVNRQRNLLMHEKSNRSSSTTQHINVRILFSHANVLKSSERTKNWASCECKTWRFLENLRSNKWLQSKRFSTFTRNQTFAHVCLSTSLSWERFKSTFASCFKWIANRLFAKSFELSTISFVLMKVFRNCFLKIFVDSSDNYCTIERQCSLIFELVRNHFSYWCF